MVDFVDERKLPQYAILSHMWEEEEILFHEFALGPQHEVDVSRNQARPSRAAPRECFDMRRFNMSGNLQNDFPDDNGDSVSSYMSDTRATSNAEDSGSSLSSANRWERFSYGALCSNGDRHVKRGWNKILNASLQACRDGLQYLWIDTCCIDKSSSAELSEAINSMYRWYSSSAVCYAFLSDCNRCPAMDHVQQPAGWDYFAHTPSPFNPDSVKNDDPYSPFNYWHTLQRYAPGFTASTTLGIWKMSLMESDSEISGDDSTFLPILGKILLREKPLNQCTLQSLRESRWIKRGWTLQELVAPRDLVIFDKRWCKVGRKRQMIRALTSITGIHVPALYSGYWEFTTVAQRMSWACNRKTTRIEDEAYCLMGLFDITMPLLYGEGAKAFRRLQEAILQNSTDASLFSWERHDGQRSFAVEQLFAPSPANFCWHASEITSNATSKASSHMQLTNEGLLATLHLVEWPQYFGEDVSIALLGCHVENGAWIGLRLENSKKRIRGTKISDDLGPDSTMYTRVAVQSEHCRLLAIPPYRIRNHPVRLVIKLTIQYGEEITLLPPLGLHYNRCRISFGLPREGERRALRLIASYPSFHWNACDCSIDLPIEPEAPYGAVAFRIAGRSHLTYAVLFRGTFPVHWFIVVVPEEHGYHHHGVSGRSRLPTLIKKPGIRLSGFEETEPKTYTSRRSERLPWALDPPVISTSFPPPSHLCLLEQKLQMLCANAELSHAKPVDYQIRLHDSHESIQLPDESLLRVTLKDRRVSLTCSGTAILGDLKFELVDNERS